MNRNMILVVCELQTCDLSLSAFNSDMNKWVLDNKSERAVENWNSLDIKTSWDIKYSYINLNISKSSKLNHQSCANSFFLSSETSLRTKKEIYEAFF